MAGRWAGWRRKVAPADGPQLEEIVITGLRQSLVNSESIKRDASGVVDAITAEDIGKFPDTNLAEAVQRVPGVTIDRDNNEGARVTVRGFGPEFNLVTLNGRSMPGNIIPGGASATRSFHFENLSADGIAGITVYKTGRADIASGGIGSTIDIKTARPFDYDGMKAAFSAAADKDASTQVGGKITPEFSGLFSDKFFDDRVGFLVNGSYSKRNSQEQISGVDGWLQNQFSPGQEHRTRQRYGPTTIPIPFPVTTGRHATTNWGVVDHARTRTNGRPGRSAVQARGFLVAVATADYTYTYYKDIEDRHTFGAWFDYAGSPSSSTINSQLTVTNLVDNGSDLSLS